MAFRGVITRNSMSNTCGVFPPTVFDRSQMHIVFKLDAGSLLGCRVKKQVQSHMFGVEDTAS